MGTQFFTPRVTDVKENVNSMGTLLVLYVKKPLRMFLQNGKLMIDVSHVLMQPLLQMEILSNFGRLPMCAKNAFKECFKYCFLFCFFFSIFVFSNFYFELFFNGLVVALEKK